MFIGEYELRIDHKGRVAIPTRFREAFQDGIVVSRGIDKCLIVYTLPEWQKVAESLASMPLTQSNARRITLFMFSGAFEIGLDRQGRVVLPPALRQYAGINDEVVVIGAYRQLQIWARDLWNIEKQFMVDHVAEISEAV